MGVLAPGRGATIVPRGNVGEASLVTARPIGGPVSGPLDSGVGAAPAVTVIAPVRITRGPTSSPARASGTSLTSSRRGHGGHSVAGVPREGVSGVTSRSGACSSAAQAPTATLTHI